MLTFPQSAVDRFYKEEWAMVKDGHRRLGQAFHQYMKLERVQCNEDDKVFCDRLYQADGSKAKAMIAERTDASN